MSRQRTPFFGPSDMQRGTTVVTGTTVVGPGAPRSEVFQEMHRVLKPGGRMSLESPGTAGTGGTGWDSEKLKRCCHHVLQQPLFLHQGMGQICGNFQVVSLGYGYRLCRLYSQVIQFILVAAIGIPNLDDVVCKCW